MIVAIAKILREKKGGTLPDMVEDQLNSDADVLNYVATVSAAPDRFR